MAVEIPWRDVARRLGHAAKSGNQADMDAALADLEEVEPGIFDEPPEMDVAQKQAAAEAAVALELAQLGDQLESDRPS